MQSDSFAPYSGLITANYAGPDVLPNQSLRIVSMTVYLGSAAVVSYSTRPRFVASEALFLFCFHHATADEIGTMAGLFAPSGFLEGIKVLAPTPCAHLIVVTVTALRELNHSLLHPTTPTSIYYPYRCNFAQGSSSLCPFRVVQQQLHQGEALRRHAACSIWSMLHW